MKTRVSISPCGPSPAHPTVYVSSSLLGGMPSNRNSLLPLVWRTCQRGSGHAPRSQCSPAAQRSPWQAGCPSRDLPGAEMNSGEMGRWPLCFCLASRPECVEREADHPPPTWPEPQGRLPGLAPAWMDAERLGPQEAREPLLCCGTPGLWTKGIGRVEA